MADIVIAHETPTVISTAASTQLAGATRLDHAGRFAFIPAPDNNFVDIIDIGNPELMERVIGINVPDSKPIDITISGRYAYISTLNKLQIADISDLTNVAIIGKTPSLGTDLRDIFVIGKYALVLIQLPTPRIAVIDIEDPTNPFEIVSSSLTLNNTPVRAHYNFGFIYTCDAEGGAHSIDVRDPLNPKLHSHFDTTTFPELAGDGKDVYVTGRWGYFLYDNPSKLVLLDLSETLEPAPEPPFTVSPASTIEVHGDHAYLSSGEIIDVSDPFNLSSLVNGGFNADMITMLGKNGYGLVNNQLKSYSYSGIDSPTGNIYSLKTSKLTVFDDIDACNNVTIHNKLNVGPGGAHIDGDTSAKNISLSGNLKLGQKSLSSDPGAVTFDPVKSVMNVRNAFPGSSLQVGQEMYIYVKNVSGGTLEEGDVVRTIGYNITDDAIEVDKGLANVVETAGVLGMVTTKMLTNETGLVTIIGRVNDLDTSACNAGQRVYLSSSVAGKFTPTKPLAIPIQVGYVGKVDSTKGFIQVNIRELPSSIRGVFSDTTEQSFVPNISKPIKFNTNDVIAGIGHDTVTDNEIITFESGGVYVITIEPQYTRLSGGPTDVLSMFIQKDIGSGFVNVVDSNIKVAISNNSLEQVTSLTQTLKFNAGDKIRIMVQCEAGDFILEAFPAFGSGVNQVPATPSVIMNIQRIGD